MTGRTLVFGAQGQLGKAIQDTLERRGRDCIGLGRAECDVTDRAQVQAAFREHQPDFVFNATAYNNVDGAEDEHKQAFLLNAHVPGLLSAACREADAVFMHISTDYVFGHGHQQPIDEGCVPRPLSVYARSKFLGEQYALQNNARTFVVRVCGLYSHRRQNFVRTMLKHGLAGRSLTVVSDQFVSPTWVEPLSDVLLELSDTSVFGVYHAVSHGQCSWFEYARAIFEILEVDVEVAPTTQAEWGAKAERPEYSVLENRMLQITGLDRLEDWRAALTRFLRVHGDALREEFTSGT